MSTAKRLTSNSVLLMSSEIAARAFRLVLVIFAARILGAEDYGKFTFAIAFNSIFLFFTEWGIHQLVVREVARKPETATKLIGNAIVVKFIFVGLTFSLMYFVMELSGKPGNVQLVVYLIAISYYLNSLSNLLKSVFQASEQMKYDAYSTLLLSGLIVCIGVGILYMTQDYIMLAYGYILASLINCLFCYYITVSRFTRVLPQVDLNTMKLLVKEGFPFGILFIAAVLYTYIDTVMLSFLQGDEVVGWYNAAYRLVFAMLFIPQGLMKAAFPVMSRYFKDSRDKFNTLFQRCFKLMLIVGFPLALGITLLSDEIILLIYGEEYRSSVIVLQLLVWSSAMVFITTVLTHTTRASDYQRFTAKIVSLGAVINVLLNIVLIPNYSYIGAATATIATQMFTFTAHLIFVNKNIEKVPFRTLSWKTTVVCLSMGLVLLHFKSINVTFAVLSSVAISFLTVLIVKYFDKNELHQANELFKGLTANIVTVLGMSTNIKRIKN